MERIGVRELRRNTGRYLARVKAGETVGVTERGQLVALLTPIASAPAARQARHGGAPHPGVPSSRLPVQIVNIPGERARPRRAAANDRSCSFHYMKGSLHVMQVEAPPLLPLLRSRLQADLLTLILLTPEREWSLTELADRSGASAATAGREVTRAEAAGVVRSRRQGNTRLVQAADSPLTPLLAELLLRSFGPRQVVAEELSPLPGIERVYLFGSWAARYAGVAGRPPVDIDVLVIGAPNRDDLDDAAQRAGARLAREVNVAIRSQQWWAGGSDGFHTEVVSRPLVPVLGDDAPVEAP